MIISGRVKRATLVSAALTAIALSVTFTAPAASALPVSPAHGKPSTSPGGQTAAPAHGKSSTATGGQSDPPAHGKSSTMAAGSANGDNGDVKIHNSTTAVTDQRNEPHVCVFYLDGFNFDSAQSVSWQIESWPPTGNRSVVASGALVLGSDGNGHTADMSLQNGHYKLFWNFVGENGFAKQKVFWVRCPAQSPGPGHMPPSIPSAPTAKPVNSTLPVTG
jgi:hypothetical protein